MDTIKKIVGIALIAFVVSFGTTKLFGPSVGMIGSTPTFHAYQGGTDNNTYREGDILVASKSASVFELSRVASGSAGQVLTPNSSGHPSIGWTNNLVGNLVIGRSTASSSSIYAAEVGAGTTASASFLISGKGCIQMLNSAGQTVYARVVGTTWTVNTTKCHQ